MVVAKMRCMSVTRTWDKVEGVELQPVHAKSNGDVIPENRVFWNATPSGKLEFYTAMPSAHGRYEPGEYYKLSFEDGEPDPFVGHVTRWYVSSVHLHSARVGVGHVGSGEVQCHPDWIKPEGEVDVNRETWEKYVNGTMRLSINNVKALDWFTVGKVFQLRITPSE